MSSSVQRNDYTYSFLNNPVVSSRWFVIALLIAGAVLSVFGGMGAFAAPHLSAPVVQMISYPGCLAFFVTGLTLGALGGTLGIVLLVKYGLLRAGSLEGAVHDENIEAVSFHLAKPNTNVNAQIKGCGSPPMHLAIEKGRVAIFKVLYARDDINLNAQDQYQRTPLHVAIVNNQLEIARQLVEDPRTDVNACAHGRTSLYIAVENKASVELVQILLTRADLTMEMTNPVNQNPLHIAIENKSNDLFDVLFEHMSRLSEEKKRQIFNMQSAVKHERSPLLLAVWENNTAAALKLLQEPSVDVNKQDASGATALQVAAWKGLQEVIEALANRPDIKKDVRNKQGHTAFGLAKTEEIKKICRF